MQSFILGRKGGWKDICAPLKISPLLQANTEIIQHKMYDFEEIVSVWNRNGEDLKMDKDWRKNHCHTV